MTISAAYNRDANHVPITNLGFQLDPKTVTFTGAAGAGAVGTIPLYNVTGTVLIICPALCTSDLVSAGGGTVEIGVANGTGGTSAITGQQTATDINQYGVWYESTVGPASYVAAGDFHLVNQDVNITVGTADVTGGSLTFYGWWIPLSTDGNVELA